jgi:hypothetical protein
LNNTEIGPEGAAALADACSCNTSLLLMNLPRHPDLVEYIQKIDLNLKANRFLKQTLFNNSRTNIPSFLWPHIYSRISFKAAALYRFVRENEKLIESSTDGYVLA